MNDHGLDIARAAFEKFERDAQRRGVTLGQVVRERLAS